MHRNLNRMGTLRVGNQAKNSLQNLASYYSTTAPASVEYKKAHHLSPKTED